MFLLTALALTTLLQEDEDLGRRVHVLVEQIESDDLDKAHAAITELITLGPKAKAHISSEASSASKDTKLKLEEVTRRINRGELLRKAVGEPLLVTLDAKDRPFQDVIQELRKVTGQPLRVYGKDSQRPITLSLKNIPFWEAIQAVCKAEGEMEWWVGAKGNEVWFGKNADHTLPTISKGNIALRFDRLSLLSEKLGAAVALNLRCDLASLDGTRPSFAWLEVESWEDDKGQCLRQSQEGPLSGSIIQPEDAPVNRIHIPCSWWAYKPAPDPTSTKLLYLRGKVHFRYVLETRTLLHIDDLRKVQGTTHKAEDFALAITSVEPRSKGLRVCTELITAKGSDSSIQSRDVFFLLKEGKRRLVPWTLANSVSAGPDSFTRFIDLDWSWEKEGLPLELEVVCPGDVEDLEIPFELKNVPLKP